MKDRYLFRAKRMDNGEWVVGSLVYTDDADDDYKTIIIPSVNSNMFTQESCNEDLGFENWYKVDQSTICQCTGLKDKNGKLIWENDIVGFCDTYRRVEMNCIGKVVWDDETISFQVTHRLSAESDEVLGDCDVIGNIFDNIELL